ncbi:hypothetical protein APUTEX25_003589 [Auxenochlorella protothecoides]|uniref:FAS1 domain-containing protein n=1 Tax=Auxenochlorella protothecoides TaxID=3075 RepID=A0A3M7L0A7_AUXPR|nr:hypothetical protein APUTEX25_003589 [Auxenochlorella protothecoides]|eukprot:RMZ55465.1 hypothetical protein APUTEX25_003589 [Auxenochlorella protothecoides]
MQLDGVRNTLSDPAFKGTAFVPTNAAWSNLLTALGWSQDQLLDAGSRDALNETLQYTIVPGAAQTQRALAGLTYLAPLPTVDSETGYLRVVSTSRQPAVVDFNATISSCQNQAVAYFVDQVPLPDPAWVSS